MKYVLSIDQSTQGTKAILFDEAGGIVQKAYRAHRQIIDERGYISHDLNEIWENLLSAARECVEGREGEVAAIGISNQRETSCIWNDDGPLAPAVVWQCARGREVTESLGEYAEFIRERTGLPLSPYFPAAKYAWLLRHTPVSGKVRLGTVDSFLVWKMTGRHMTDYSNASRTQLFNLTTLAWDKELLRLFGVEEGMLPEVAASDEVFGVTTLEGIFPRPVPVSGVLGDSHAALYAEGCTTPGACKVTYGTGSSVMMNVGERLKRSSRGLASSLAWKAGGKVNFVLEGNINYSCAVITWLKDDLGLIASAKEAGTLASEANDKDTSVLIPAFSGLSAPYWKENAKACIFGMTRTTGKRELCRAAEESIAFQISDILDALRADTGYALNFVNADGGATGDSFLMQRQADFASCRVRTSNVQELSALGAALLAGRTVGLYESYAPAFSGEYAPQMPEDLRQEKRARWNACLTDCVKGDKL